jgi:hypothetical protein
MSRASYDSGDNQTSDKIREVVYESSYIISSMSSSLMGCSPTHSSGFSFPKVYCLRNGRLIHSPWAFTTGNCPLFMRGHL